MKKIVLLVLMATAPLIISCASGFKDIKVSAQSDPKVNLAQYKSYAWLGTAQILWDEYGQWEPPQFDADAEVQFLINREMREHGKTEVSENPDLLIGYAAGIDIDALEIEENPDTKALDIKEIPKGALVIMFIDAQSGYPVWLAEAEAGVEMKPEAESAKKRLDYAVTQMFKKL